MNFLVHHQCFKNKEATKFAITSFKEYNPEVPYVLWSDAGDDYSDVDGVNYFHSPINVGYRFYDKDKAFELVDRVRKSCELNPSLPYVMWMEDDVLVKGPVKVPSGIDFCAGPDMGNKYQPGVIEYLIGKYNVNPNFDFYCTAGGTIMSTDVFTTNFSLLERFLDEDYEYIVEKMWRDLPHHDIMIMTLHLICGKQYSVNPCHVELLRNPDWKNEKYTVVHGYKDNYIK